MRISCPKCGVSYVVPEDRLRGRATFEMACHECGSVIEVPGLVRGGLESPSSRSRTEFDDEGTTRLLGEPRNAPPPSSGIVETSGAEWYVVRSGQAVGPFDLATLREQAANGELGAEDLVSQPGATAWVPARTIPELTGLFDLPPQEEKPIARLDLPSELPSLTPAVSPQSVSATVLRPSVSAGIASRIVAFSRRPSRVRGAHVLGAIALIVSVGAAGTLVARSLSARATTKRTSVMRDAGSITTVSQPVTAAADGSSTSAPDDAGAASTSPLPGSSSFWASEGLIWVGTTCTSGLWSIFTGPAPGRDEFERHANDQGRVELAQRLRASTFALHVNGNVTLGDYDFTRQAFPIQIALESLPQCSLAESEGLDEDVTPDVSFSLSAPRLGTIPGAEGNPADANLTAEVHCTVPEGLRGYRWVSSPTTIWLPVALDQAPAYRGRHAGTLSAQIALRVQATRFDHTRAMLFARTTTMRYACILHAGAGRVVTGRMVGAQINDGQEVLLDTAPRTLSDAGVVTHGM